MARNNAPWVSLDYLKLLLSEQDPNVITDYVKKNLNSFRRILLMDLRSAGLILVLKILVRISNVEFDLSKGEILQMTFDEVFTNNIRNYLNNVNNGNIQVKYYVMKEDLRLIVTFLDIIVNELPISAKYYAQFITLLEEVLKTIINVKLGNLPLRSWTEDLILLLKQKTLELNRINCSYKDLGLYPSPIHFFEEKERRENKINQSYLNAQEYLDIHFKLLQADYIKSVSDGIKQYKREIRGAEKTMNPTINVYEDVLVQSIGTNKYARDGILHVVLFSPQDEKRIYDEKYENKRFMNGQLLYLSSYSHFTVFVIATVVDRKHIVIDEDKRERRALRISVVGDPFKLRLNEKYDLIEPKAFFEPYYQVLKTFQSIKPSAFPMSKYILHLDFVPCLPNYLTPREANLFLNHFDSQISPMVTLNNSQQEALKTALTNDFTIIQGPPGTGKTHLVKSIIKVLINFRGNRSAPILIVCARNNSLDHVIGPLSESGKNIIRLGGQTKNEILKDCTVSKLRSNSRSNKRATINRINELKNSLLNKQNEHFSNYYPQFAELQKEISAYTNLCDEEDAEAILASGTDVVGATTTGAARLSYMISLIRPEVVIIEEAAEVFESHVVSSLPQGCKHVILIGDHKQLQPKPTHNSSEKYKMHISLFERLVENGMNFCSLTEQHRMRPEIAALICPLIYEGLTNHDSVKNYPNIKGLAKNIFFIDHMIPEEEETDTGSHMNVYEARTLLALADYLIKQEYAPEEITILAGYSAQVTLLTELSTKYHSLKGMKVTSIDNYQGEENIIILLSLVRSQTGSIGFLKTHNRVNVALSRAKHGLYVIGNMSDLSSQSPLWQSLKRIFQQNSAIDKRLPLKCQTHQNTTYVKSEKDFKKLTYGGCASPCGLELECGHSCMLLCHPLLLMHNNYKCEQSCQRIICKEHNTKCTLKCFEECNNKCPVINIEILACGHSVQNECFNKTPIKCTTLVTKTLPCGHNAKVICHLNATNMQNVCDQPCSRIICREHNTKCMLKCFEDCNNKCPVIISKRLACGHSVQNECFNKRSIKCTTLITKTLPCGHNAKVICHLNATNMQNVCDQPCSRTICAQHNTKCKSKCFEDCDKCSVLVTRKLSCGHYVRSQCWNKCFKCTRKELITLSCGHEVNLLCHLKSSYRLNDLNVNCNKPCSRVCKNGHQCHKKCRERCGPCMVPVRKEYFCCLTKEALCLRAYR